MIDLSEVSGLPLQFDDENLLLVSTSSDLVLPEPGLRRLDDLRPVLLDPNCAGPDSVYRMYRDVRLRAHDNILRQYSLRYDISVFWGTKLGREYFKTYGHYHPPIPSDPVLSYPEVYEVLYGEALFLLQRVDDIYKDLFYVEVKDIIAIHVRAGEKVIMPPNYGHVTINLGPGPMVDANWVCNDFSSHYVSVRQARGFAYYLIDDGGKPRWIPNEKYRQPLPPLRQAETLEAPELGIRLDTPLYISGSSSPATLTWLCSPADYLEQIWDSIKIAN